MRIVEIQLYNRAPFKDLLLKLDAKNVFVLSGINGVGKTTIISYIVDAFYELAKKGFNFEFADVINKFYRVSSGLYILDYKKPSFVYIRFENDGKEFDYIDIMNFSNTSLYNEAIQIEGAITADKIKEKIGSARVLKYFSLSNNEIIKLFENNVLTYFPSYRYENPAYLNEPYSISLAFRKDAQFEGYLKNPIEVTSGLKDIANWMMDIVLDVALYKSDERNSLILSHVNEIFSVLLQAKIGGSIRLGIGPRQNSAVRIQIIKEETGKTLYPSIFNMSSGEHSLISLFCELIRQADNLGKMDDEIHGVVLIDEIDKHLHIKLQKDALPRLMKLFPNIQFIVTSHSPFFNLGLDSFIPDDYKIYDLDIGGTPCSPRANSLFKEVYEMMILENEQYAKRYKDISKKMEISTTPLIITEGKTDWKHLKSAMRALNLDLKIDFHETDDPMGDVTLLKLLKSLSVIPHGRKIIGLFDRDNEDILKEIASKGESYHMISKNIYAISIPMVNQKSYGPYTSIEHYYIKEELLKKNQNERRFFLGDEFYESGISKDGMFVTKVKNIKNKVKINGIIDEKVYIIGDDPKCEKSVALSKDEFATLIYTEDEYSRDFDFSAFNKIFDIIKEVLNINKI